MPKSPKKKVIKFTHNCLKCSAVYKDEDPDPYYCKTCHKEAQEIAKQIDKKLKGNSKRQVKSDLQIIEEKGQSLNGGRSTFVRASDLGINLT